MTTPTKRYEYQSPKTISTTPQTLKSITRTIENTEDYEIKRLGRDIEYLKYELQLAMQRTPPKFRYDSLSSKSYIQETDDRHMVQKDELSLDEYGQGNELIIK